MFEQPVRNEQVVRMCEHQKIDALHIGLPVQGDPLLIRLTDHVCKVGVLGKQCVQNLVLAIDIVHYVLIGSCNVIGLLERL
jgi:hypothetical protein